MGRVGIGERERTNGQTSGKNGVPLALRVQLFLLKSDLEEDMRERERARREEGDMLPVVRPGCVCVYVYEWE